MTDRSVLLRTSVNGQERNFVSPKFGRGGEKFTHKGTVEI